VGGALNAFTGEEQTCYYAKVPAKHFETTMDILSDMVFFPLIQKNDLERERGIILEEIKMYQDNPMMGMSGDFTKFLYNDSKIGCWNIAGEVKDIEEFNKEKLLDYHSKYFNPKEMVIVISGNVDPSIESVIRDCFENFVNNNIKALPKVEVLLNKEIQKAIKKDIEQGHFCIGIPALTSIDKRKYALKLLDIILSGNSSSRLYTKIREERALAYYVFSISESFIETGFLGVQSGVKIDKIDEAQEIVVNEFLSMKDTLREEELKRAKEFLIGKTQLAMDRSDFISGYVGQKMLLENEAETVENEIERYKKVQLSELKELSEALFKKENIRSLIVKK
jgi:predicted Zn-dependent peptidase